MSRKYHNPISLILLESGIAGFKGVWTHHIYHRSASSRPICCKHFL